MQHVLCVLQQNIHKQPCQHCFLNHPCVTANKVHIETKTDGIVKALWMFIVASTHQC